ncbi:MAG TPA: VanW family protein [Clostridia bacterium]|nr:VanW family protein [Clostridia bacterium]
MEKIIAFGTDLSKSSADRTNNVITAALAFNGLMVSPGETVSFNEVTGKRTSDKGYGYAPMISNRRFVDVLGGGVSQTSTTLYNTAIRAGLDIIERTRHSLPSSYIDMGLDTTVNLPPPEPTIDLKFRNNRGSPIYIRAYFADKRVYFEIYGEPLPRGQRYEFYSEVYETIPAPAPDIIVDYEARYTEFEGEEYIHTESRNGYKVRVFKQTFQDDELVGEELFDTHYYRPVKGKTYIGKKKATN